MNYATQSKRLYPYTRVPPMRISLGPPPFNFTWQMSAMSIALLGEPQNPANNTTTAIAGLICIGFIIATIVYATIIIRAWIRRRRTHNRHMGRLRDLPPRDDDC